MNPDRFAALMTPEVLNAIRGAARALHTKVRRLDVEDATSAGYLAVVEQADHYDPERGGFQAWAVTVARNAMRKSFGIYGPASRGPALRREVLDSPTVGLQADIGGGDLLDRSELGCLSPSPEELVIRAEDEAGLDRALSDLDEGDREALMADGPRTQAQRVRASKVARRVWRDVYGEEPAGRRMEAQSGADRSRRWYANLTPEQKAERQAKKMARRRAARLVTP